jgi:hypothetical protein
VAKGTDGRLAAVTTDIRWTALGITEGTDEPVLGVAIMQGERSQLPYHVFNGFDPFVDCNDLEDFDGSVGDWVENYTGRGKAMPGGPECMFRGIAGAILNDILKYMNSLDLFPRKDGGPRPFFLLDRHGNRFDLKFLEYINTSETEWIVCLGLSYGTHNWQVGDSSQQNGAYKVG